MPRFAFANVQNGGRRRSRRTSRAQCQSEGMRGDTRREYFAEQVRHKVGSAQFRRYDGDVY